MKKILYLVSALLLFWSCENVEKPDKKSPSRPKIDYAARAKEVYDFIEANYRVRGGSHDGMMYEYAPYASGDVPCAFIWPYDWYMTGVTLMDDLGYDVGFEEGIETYQRYWQPDGNGIHYYTGVEYKTPGYSSGSSGAVDGGNKTGDRYYDDNAWVGGNLVDAYVKTGDEKYLQRAKAVIDFLYTGLDDELGGGIWWNEARRDPTNGTAYKPICANGPFGVLLLRYYKECPDQAQQTKIFRDGKDIYDWMRDVLRDDDYLFWGDIQDNGKINKAKDPAITGLAIQCAVLLYEITGEKSYLNDAMKSADAAFKYFTTYRSGLMHYAYNFNHSTIKLIRSYYALHPYYPKTEQYINTYVKYCDWVYENRRTPAGFFHEYTWGEDQGNIKWLITQCTYLEAYASIALFKRDGKVRH